MKSTRFATRSLFQGAAARRALFAALIAFVAAVGVLVVGEARGEEARGRLKALVLSAGSFDDFGLKDLLGGDAKGKADVVAASENAVNNALNEVVGDDVQRLSNKRRNDFWKKIEETANGLDEEDALVVYFCGFATTSQDKDDLLLWAKDTKRGDDSSALSASRIRQTLAEARSRKTFFIVDAQTYGRGSWEAQERTDPSRRALEPALGETEELARLIVPSNDSADVATLVNTPNGLKYGSNTFGLVSLDDATVFSSLVALGLLGFADRSAVGKVSVAKLVEFVQNGASAVRNEDEEGDVALWGSEKARSFALVENYKLEEKAIVDGLARFAKIYAVAKQCETGAKELKIACPRFDCGSISPGTNLPAFKDSDRYVGEKLLTDLNLNNGGRVEFEASDSDDDGDLVLRNTVEARENGFLYKTVVKPYEAEITAFIPSGESKFDENRPQRATPTDGEASTVDESAPLPSQAPENSPREKARPIKLRLVKEFPGTVAVLVDGNEREQYVAKDGRENVVALYPGETYSIRVRTNPNLLSKYPGGIGVAILVDGRTSLNKRPDGASEELSLEDFPFVTPEEAPFYVLDKPGSYDFKGYVCLDSEGNRNEARAFVVKEAVDDDRRRNIINDDCVGAISAWFYELKPTTEGRSGPEIKGSVGEAKTDLGRRVDAKVKKLSVPREKKNGGAYGVYRLWYEPK